MGNIICSYIWDCKWLNVVWQQNRRGVRTAVNALSSDTQKSDNADQQLQHNLEHEDHNISKSRNEHNDGNDDIINVEKESLNQQYPESMNDDTHFHSRKASAPPPQKNRIKWIWMLMTIPLQWVNKTTVVRQMITSLIMTKYQWVPKTFKMRNEWIVISVMIHNGMVWNPTMALIMTLEWTEIVNIGQPSLDQENSS